MTLARHEITGLLLAGGEGRRMGGVDKGLQLLEGAPLAAHVIRRLVPQVGSLLISANRHVDAYAALGAPVLTDSVHDLDGRTAGPLAGMLAGLRACRTPWLLCAPCDTPFLPADLGQQLATAVIPPHDAPLAAAWASTPATADESARSHPTCCLLRADLAESLQAYLDSGERRVEHWLRSLPHAVVCFDDAAAFRNINSLDLLRQLGAG